jgi:hypothetical protein
MQKRRYICTIMMVISMLSQKWLHSSVATIIAQTVIKDTIIKESIFVTTFAIIASKYMTFKRSNGNIVRPVIDIL